MNARLNEECNKLYSLTHLKNTELCIVNLVIEKFFFLNTIFELLFDETFIELDFLV